MFLWSYFICPLIPVFFFSPIWHVLHNNTRHWTRSSFTVCSLYPSVTFVALHTVPYVLCHMSPFFFVGGDASLCYIISSSPLLLTLFLSFFFFLKYPLSICCSSGPFSPQGSLKLHLVTSTPTLTFFPPPPRLIFLQTLPEVFLPRGSSFLTASLHCGVSILSLAQRKQYRRMEGRRLLRDLLWHSDADGLPPKKTLCFQLFIFSLWTLLCLHGECREGDLRDLKW